jgi:hypothetical protein
LPPRTQSSPISPTPSDFDVRNRDADGPRLARGIQRILCHDRAGFAESVTFDERDAELLFEIAQYLNRQRRGAADADAQWQGSGNFRIHQTSIKLRDRRQNGRMALENFLNQIANRMQRFDEHDRRAGEQREHYADSEHVAVKKRQQHRQPIFLHCSEADVTALDVVQQVAIGKHRAFGPTGRAGRVDQDGQIIFATRGIAEQLRVELQVRRRNGKGRENVFGVHQP